MSRINIEPIIELFIDEGFSLVSDIEACIQARQKRGQDSSAFLPVELEELQSSIHTMKVNATMVLFDEIANVSKSMDKLLTWRRQTADAEDAFLCRMLIETAEFFQEEVEKVASGRLPDGDGSSISNEIQAYLLDKEQGPEVWKQEERMKQCYYIPGIAEDGE